MCFRFVSNAGFKQKTVQARQAVVCPENLTNTGKDHFVPGRVRKTHGTEIDKDLRRRKRQADSEAGCFRVPVFTGVKESQPGVLIAISHEIYNRNFSFQLLYRSLPWCGISFRPVLVVIISQDLPVFNLETIEKMKMYYEREYYCVIRPKL